MVTYTWIRTRKTGCQILPPSSTGDSAVSPGVSFSGPTQAARERQSDTSRGKSHIRRFIYIFSFCSSLDPRVSFTVRRNFLCVMRYALCACASRVCVLLYTSFWPLSRKTGATTKNDNRNERRAPVVFLQNFKNRRFWPVLKRNSRYFADSSCAKPKRGV